MNHLVTDNVKGTPTEPMEPINCICDYDKDDGNIVYCDRCETWQHIRCFYPYMNKEDLEFLDHLCADCYPRPLGAVELNRKTKTIRGEDQLEERGVSPSQGDAVLTDFMGGPSLPTLAEGLPRTLFQQKS